MLTVCESESWLILLCGRAVVWGLVALHCSTVSERCVCEEDMQEEMPYTNVLEMHVYVYLNPF